MIPRDHPVVEGECDVGQGGRQAVRGGPDDALQLGTPVIAQIARDAALERRQTGERLVLMGAQHVARRFRGARDRDGRQSAVCSITCASSMSLAVTPPALCVQSFTCTFPQLTARSG